MARYKVTDKTTDTDTGNYNDWVSDEGLKKGWLANWLITERVTGLADSCIQLTQSDKSAHGLIVVKEIRHTQVYSSWRVGTIPTVLQVMALNKPFTAHCFY